ncbi:MAG: hypothetical protein ACJ748_10420 [Flavisolibacter sp.]
MKGDVHKIDELFKNALEKEQENPPSGVWNFIDKELDKHKVISIQRKYDILKKVAAALVIFCFMASVYALYLHNKNSNEDFANLKNNKKLINKDDKSHETVQSNVKNSLNKKQLPDPINTATITSSNKSISPSNKKEVSTNVTVNQKEYETTNEYFQSMTDKTLNRKIYRGKKFNVYKSEGNLGGDDKNTTIWKEGSDKKKSVKGNRTNIEKIGNTNDMISYHSKPFFDAQLNYPLIKIGNYTSNKRKSIVNEIAVQTRHGIIKNAHLSLSVSISPESESNHIKDNYHAMLGGNRDDYKSKEETSSFSIGLQFNYSLNSKWSIKSGLIYSTSSATLSPKKLFAQPDNAGHIGYELHCSAGYSYVSSKTGGTPSVGDSALAISSRNSLKYVSIPIAIDYIINAGKFTIRPSIGIAANFLLKGNVTTNLISNYGNETIANTSIEGLKSSYLSSIIGLSAEYSLNKALSIGIGPAGRFAISSINNNTPVKTYPSYVGLSGTMRVSF